MVKKIIITVIIAIGLATVSYFILRSPNDKQIIISRLHDLVANVSKKDGEGPLEMAVKHQAISGFIDQQCAMYIKEAMLTGDFTPEEFASRITRSRTLFKSLNGKIDSCEVQLDAAKKSATVEFAIRVIAELKSGEKFDEVRDLRAKVRKVDGKWVFSSFEIHKVLEK